MLILNINRPPCSYFSFFAKMVVLEVAHRLMSVLARRMWNPNVGESPKSENPHSGIQSRGIPNQSRTNVEESPR
jgi:hypothetical protein